MPMTPSGGVQGFSDVLGDLCGRALGRIDDEIVNGQIADVDLVMLSIALGLGSLAFAHGCCCRLRSLSVTLAEPLRASQNRCLQPHLECG